VNDSFFLGGGGADKLCSSLKQSSQKAAKLLASRLQKSSLLEAKLESHTGAKIQPFFSGLVKELTFVRGK